MISKGIINRWDLKDIKPNTTCRLYLDHDSNFFKNYDSGISASPIAE